MLLHVDACLVGKDVVCDDSIVNVYGSGDKEIPKVSHTGKARPSRLAGIRLRRLQYRSSTMSTSHSQSRPTLSRTEGRALFSSSEALLKGCLIAESPVHLLTGAASPWFVNIVRTAEKDANEELLRRHETTVKTAVDASRAITLGVFDARAGRSSVIVVPNRQLHQAAEGLAQNLPFEPSDVGSLVLIVENSPATVGNVSPRSALRELDLPMLELATLADLPESVERAMLLSRAAGRPSVVIVHDRLVRSYETLSCLPNRVVDVVDLDVQLRHRRQRRMRISESDDVIRVARRLELNMLQNLPSPGERAEYGFVLIGPAASAMRHVLHQLQLTGRVPLLQLQLIQPIDDPAVMRFLDRCEHAIILEPRPGESEGSLLAIAERMRAKGDRPATLWGRDIPPGSLEQSPPPLAVDETLHPSIIARRLLHLLHQVRPGKRVADRLLKDDATSNAEQSLILRNAMQSQRPLERMWTILADLDQWLDTRAPLEQQEIERTSIVVDGGRSHSPRTIRAEIWEATNFLAHGRSAVQQTAIDAGNWFFLIRASTESEAKAAARLAAAVVPSGKSDRVRVHDLGSVSDDRLRRDLRPMALQDGVHAITFHMADGDDVDERWRRKGTVESVYDIDRQGFRRCDGFVQTADAACDFSQQRQLSSVPAQHLAIEVGSAGGGGRGGVSYAIDKLSEKVPSQFRIRLRPLLETVEIVRSKPPMVSERSSSDDRLPLPSIVHGNQAVWRMHWAGTRGEGPGLAVRILLEAGCQQGYQTRCQFDSTPIAKGIGRSADVMFTQLQDDGSPLPLTSYIPFGEADVILANDLLHAARACDGAFSRRIATPHRTSAVIDTAHSLAKIAKFEGELPAETLATRAALAILDNHIIADANHAHDFSTPARNMFGTERPADLVLLGAAYQHGLIPLPLSALEQTLAAFEKRGYLRCVVAFQLGRKIVAETSDANGKRSSANIHDDDRHIRRAVRFLRREGRPLRRMAADFERVLRESLDAMPGLAETESGRVAREAFIRAMERCVRWGGVSYCRQLAELVHAMYKIDRGETGRALTRHTILPLAESMLIRDAGYVSRMALSMEAKHLIRQRLNGKPSRGDELTRRFLNRFEVITGHYRVRFHFRTSDWTAALISKVVRLRPMRWRGSAADRARRNYIADLVRRAAVSDGDQYDTWADRLRLLHRIAMDGRLRGMTVDRLDAVLFQLPDTSSLSTHPSADDDDDTRELLQVDEKEESGMPIAHG